MKKKILMSKTCCNSRKKINLLETLHSRDVTNTPIQHQEKRKNKIIEKNLYAKTQNGR